MAQILYIHGSGNTRDSFAAQASAFAGSFSLALPGHPDGAPLETVAAMAQWVSREIVARSHDPAVLCGNSLGAAVALEAALRYSSNVAGLILVGAGARLRVGKQIFEMIDQRWPACIGELVGFSVSDGCPPELRERICGWHLAVGARSTCVDYAACDAFDVMADVANIVVPTLIVVGSLDRMTPPKYARYLHEQIKGSRLLVVEGSGHMPHLEQPARVNAAIEDWTCAIGIDRRSSTGH